MSKVNYLEYKINDYKLLVKITLLLKSNYLCLCLKSGPLESLIENISIASDILFYPSKYSI